jgi:NADPH-dependent glutamate synthase beta subunit-like oxidoreductase
MAHDFNNLLAVISSYASFVHQEVASEAPTDKWRKVGQDLAELENAADRAATLTRQLLAYSRTQHAEPQVLDLNEVIRGLADLLGRTMGARIDLALDLDPEVGRVLADHGQVTGAILSDARLATDDDGTVRPELIPGTEREVICDSIFLAIGQVQQLDWLPAHLADRSGVITADEHGRVEGNVFVGGDVLRGPSMVVDALGDGKRAARDIDRLLTNQALAEDPEPVIMPYEGLNAAYFRPAARVPIPLSPAAERRRSQRVEVTLAYSQQQAVAEADRCMSCGVCNGCDNCYVVCPDVSVLRDARQGGHYSIRTTYCKGCLVCVQECPTGCLEKVPELDFDDPAEVTRMETAFAPYDGAHAEQSAFTKQLIEETIAEYDATHRRAPGDGPANGQPTSLPNANAGEMS